jgi:hypothetical protein
MGIAMLMLRTSVSLEILLELYLQCIALDQSTVGTMAPERIRYAIERRSR